MTTTVIDDKGRIQIPERIRKELSLKSREEFEVKTEGRKITLLPSIKPEVFIARMEGKIKSGNRTNSPEEIKSIRKMR